MIPGGGIMRKAGVLFGIIMGAGILFPSIAFGQYRNGGIDGGGSMAVKLLSFFPNGNTNGLKGFSPGLGVGFDGRINFGNYFALAGELDYIGVSSANQTYDVDDAYGHYLYTSTETAYFNNIELKIDALVTIPLYNVTPFFGAGIVYNNSTITYSSDFGPSSTSGEGIGLEIVAGADFMVAENGAITIEVSVPIDQTVNFDGISPSIDVGGVEVMAGYRFIF